MLLENSECELLILKIQMSEIRCCQLCLAVAFQKKSSPRRLDLGTFCIWVHKDNPAFLLSNNLKILFLR